MSRGAITCAGALWKRDRGGVFLRFCSVFRSRAINRSCTSLFTAISYQLLEHFAALFEARELVKRRAGRGKGYDVARLGMLERFVKRTFKIGSGVHRQLSIFESLEETSTRCTKAHHCLAMGLGASNQIGQVGALIASTQQDDGTLFAKCGKRLQRRINVSCFRIVVAVNARDGAARLDAMFQRRKGLQALFDLCIFTTQRDGTRSRRERIGSIVLAFDLEFASAAQGMLAHHHRGMPQHLIRMHLHACFH